MNKRIQYSIFNIPNSSRTRGFTLVELLISISVLLVLTGSVLASYRGYNNNAYFANASEDIVLALRQAQVYGVGVKKDKGGSFDVPYGVYLDKEAPNKMILFADTFPVGLPDRKYTPASDDIVETISWSGTIGITNLVCGAGDCFNGAVSITFKRPNPDALIVHGDTSLKESRAVITIGNGALGSDMRTSTTTVTEAGQIYFQ